MKLFTEEFWTDVLANFTEWLVGEMPSIVILIIIFFITLKFFDKLVKRLSPFILKRKYLEKSINRVEAEKRIKTLINILKSSVRVILWVIFIMLLLPKLGIEIAPLLAGAGIVGLAIGFGAQELVRDVISGFFVLLENQIRVGDVAIINSTAGLVEKIELRTTSLRDLSGTVHIFQNGKISSLSNLTKDWSACVLEIGVAYKEDVGNVILHMQAVYKDLKSDSEFKDSIIEDFEIMGLDRFDNSAVVIKARIKTLPGEQWTIKREYQKRLKYAFDREHIEIPFPHTTLYWGDKTPPLQVIMEDKEKA